MTEQQGLEIEILLVEDNLGDIRLTIEAFKGAKIHNHLTVMRDGEEAVNFLRRAGKYADAPRPDLILLDLNIPKMSGRDVLGIIKEDPSLRRIPVVIVTSSGAESDLLSAYDLHANCYVTKPIDLNQFVKVVRSIEEFWLSIVRLPPTQRE